MDVVICLVNYDFCIVKKTILYIRKYITDVSGTIYIITQKTNFVFFSRRYKETNNVVLIDEDTLVLGMTYSSVQESLKSHFKCFFSTGWYFQQFLKMGFAETTYAKDKYLIWDSDTIPLHEIKMLSPEGKPYFTAKTENHRPYFETMERLLGFGKQKDFSFIAEHMVVEVNIMRDLLKTIQDSKTIGNSWFEKIINSTSGTHPNSFSEFETYGSYCCLFYPECYETRTLKTLRQAGFLYGHGVTKKDLKTLQLIGLDIATFERYQRPLNYRKWVNIYEVWCVRIVEKCRRVFVKFSWFVL